ncbi:MAG: anaerobic sulfatase maturase [Acidimicrobiaceae bacterium]|nr:anaerobic sulfatase maturase [Acidimicrobiaceae bacterium]
MPVTTPFVVMAKPIGPICNLRCDYCYYLQKKSLFPSTEHFRMRPEVLEAYVSSFIAESPGPMVHFVWHGGEPTLAGTDFFKKVLELQARYTPEGWQCLNNLQTNGTRLDPGWCSFLAENNFTVGLSIDGPEHLHDAYRIDRKGDATHSKVMQGLRRLRAHGIEPDILCTLNAANSKFPAEVYHFFLDQKVRWLQFLPVVTRLADGTVAPWSVKSQEMGTFLNTVFDEWIRHDLGRIGIQNFLECMLVAGGKPANICIMSETCGRVLAVEHDGGTYSCDHFVNPGNYLGNLTTDSLADLIESPVQRAFGKAKKESLPGYCKECPVLSFCNGGCPKDRFIKTPDGEDGLNYLCEGYRSYYSHLQPELEGILGFYKKGMSPQAIMAEIEKSEISARAKWKTASRNDTCPCGSGKKYKHCCFASHRR